MRHRAQHSSQLRLQLLRVATDNLPSRCRRLNEMTNDPKDPKYDKPSDDAAPESKRSGRVSFDSRGNSVWEWQLETGVYSRDVTTQKLKKLDLGELSIAESAIQPGPLSLQDEPSPGGGFNPYDSAPRSRGAAGSNPYDTARSLGNKFDSKPEPTREKPRNLDDLRKLSEWIKQKRKAEKGGGDE